MSLFKMSSRDQGKQKKWNIMGRNWETGNLEKKALRIKKKSLKWKTVLVGVDSPVEIEISSPPSSQNNFCVPVQSISHLESIYTYYNNIDVILHLRYININIILSDPQIKLDKWWKKEE
jgi:hypothetical protein